MHNMITSGKLTQSMATKTYITYLIIGFGLPLLTSCYALFEGWLGNYNNLNCSVDTNIDSWVIYVYSAYIPRFRPLIIMFFIYGKVGWFLNSTVNPIEAKRIWLQTLWFPMVYLVECLLVILYDLELNVSGRENYWLLISAHILLRLIGFFDAAIYGFNSVVQQEIRKGSMQRGLLASRREVMF